MDKWLHYYPCLHPLTVLLKCFLYVRQFNNTYKGGISSYCLFIMIVAFLKEYKMGFYNDYSHILINFLNFYGNNFDPDTTGIDLTLENS